MILYRTQACSGDSWVSEWNATAAEAKSDARKLVAAGYHSPHVDKIELGTSRESIVQALNHADVSRINWDGEEIKL